MKPTTSEHQDLLKRALTGNAVFSLLSGLVIVFANRWLVNFLGLSASISLGLGAIGISLVVYAVLLCLSTRRSHIRISNAWLAVVMDVLWVLGSCALVMVVPFSAAGKWTVILVADLVLLFAILQWLGIRRVQKSAHPA
jgi:hypothetical protein